MSRTSTNSTTPGNGHAVERGVHAAAEVARDTIDSSRATLNRALDAAQDHVDQLRHDGPGLIGRAAERVDELTRRSIDKARDTAGAIRDRADRAQIATVDYIRDEPVKSVLIAAAAGAVIAGVAGWLVSQRRR